ncbi:ribonuclease E/G, partial [Streptomyces polyrhachis]
MLEQHEPMESVSRASTSTDSNDSPGDKLPPRRRRRAASRPAGPPGTVQTEAGPADAAVAIPQDAAETAAPAVAAKAETDEAAPARPRRRATRRASAPAGAPQSDQSADTAATETGEGEIRVTDSAEQKTSTDQGGTDEAAPARPRRRATRRA